MWNMALPSGVTGKDVLLEGNWDVCELLDLGFGRCRLVVAAWGYGCRGRTIRRASSCPCPAVAISFRRPPSFRPSLGAISRRPDLCVEIIKLNGAVEIAPLQGFPM